MDLKMPTIDFGQYLEDLSFIEAPSIKPVTDFADEVHELADCGEKLIGTTLPWLKTQNQVRLAPGKLSIWAGSNGSGKSLLLGQVITHAIHSGEQAAIASLEMQPKQTLYRMICQDAKMKAKGPYCMEWLARMENHLWIYDELDKVAAARLLGMSHFSAKELGCNHIVLDSLTKAGLGRDDYEQQRDFVDRLQWCAKTWNVHIHLVCHMRKSQAPGHRENKNDIRGAAEITDLADNVFILRRNKDKEREIEKKNSGQGYDIDIATKPCAFLSVEKNRDYGIESTFGLWFDSVSGIYREQE